MIDFMFTPADRKHVHECNTTTDPDGKINWRCPKCDYMREYDPFTGHTAHTIGKGVNPSTIHIGFSSPENIDNNLN